MITRRAFCRAAIALPLTCGAAPRLLCFGDSITAGQGASAPERAYVAIVGAALGRRVDNRAIGASRLGQQLRDAIGPATIGRRDIALLLTGYNDMRAGTPLADYRQQLDAALGLLARAGAVVVGGCLPMTPAGYAAYGPTWSHGGDAAVAAYTAAIADAAQSHGCRMASLARYDPRNVASDLVHPNDAGHVQIAAAMLAALAMQLTVPLVARR